MNDLKTTTMLVKAILEEDKQSRNSDSHLYLRVLEVIAEQHGYNLKNVSVYDFLEYKATDYPFFPGFETVRRTRQKIQSEHEELRADKTVAAYRSELEKEYREYALQKG